MDFLPYGQFADSPVDDVTVTDFTVTDVTVTDFTVVEAISSEDCVVEVDNFLLCWKNVEFVFGGDPLSGSEIGRNVLYLPF